MMTLFASECPGVHYCHHSGGPLVAVRAESLAWELPALGAPGQGGCVPLATDNAPLEGCPNNRGIRIFPDKLHPNDADPPLRRQVDLVATITPPVEGVPVYMRVWDVDDPFDQVHGPGGLNDIPNVTVLDTTPTSGPDNRLPGGGDPAVGYWTVTTNQWGQARKTLTVSMQPGNNYRAAATCLSDVLAARTRK